MVRPSPYRRPWCAPGIVFNHPNTAVSPVIRAAGRNARVACQGVEEDIAGRDEVSTMPRPPVSPLGGTDNTLTESKLST